MQNPDDLSDCLCGIINVKNYGAAGDGTTDDTAAIQAAIDALTSKPLGSLAGTVFLPPGSYVVTSTFLISNGVGISLSGLGQQATTLIPSRALIGKPVIKLVNCVNCAVKDLWIQGNTCAPPSAGIESQVDHPCCPSAYPTNLLVRDVLIGSPALGSVLPGLNYGIRFTATDGSDGNNDQSTISHVTLAGLTTAGISIEHSNSLVHKFDNLRIYYVPIGVQTQGGSFQLDNSFFSVSDVEFSFLAPQGNLNGKATAGYYHPILISNTTSEWTSDLLRTAAWPPPGTPRTDGVTGIHIYLSNFGQKGTGAGTQGQLDTSIDYESPGKLSITNSHLNFGTDTNIILPNPKSVVTLTGNYLSPVHEIHYAGHLTSVGNFWSGGTATFVPLGDAVMHTLGEFNDFSQGLTLEFVAAGDLEDGRIQAFGIQTNGQIISRWKEAADPNSGWTDWADFQTPPGGVSSICVGLLSDKRMQLFATDAQGATISCWKTTTDPDSAWTAWSAF